MMNKMLKALLMYAVMFAGTTTALFSATVGGVLKAVQFEEETEVETLPTVAETTEAIEETVVYSDFFKINIGKYVRVSIPTSCFKTVDTNETVATFKYMSTDVTVKIRVGEGSNGYTYKKEDLASKYSVYSYVGDEVSYKIEGKGTTVYIETDGLESDLESSILEAIKEIILNIDIVDKNDFLFLEPEI